MKRCVGLLLLAACSRQTASGAGGDAGAWDEAATSDSHVTTADVGVSEDVLRAESGFFASGWRQATTACSNVYVADNPTVAAPITWKPCTDRPGCDRFEASWSTAFGQKLSPLQLVPAGSQPAIAYARYWPRAAGAGFDFMMHVINRPAPDPVFVMGLDRTAGSCSAVLYAGPAGVVAAVGGGDPIDTRRYVIFDYSGAVKNDLRLPLADIVEKPGYVNTVAVGRDRIFLGAREPDGIAVVDFSGVVRHRVTSSAVPLETPRALSNGGAVAGWATTPPSIAFVSDDGLASKLHTLAVGRELLALRVDPTANRIVWIDGRLASGPAGAELTDTALWEGTMPTGSLPFTARRVSGITSSALQRLEDVLLVNDGLAVIKIDDGSVRISRLGDGLGWLVKAPTGERWLRAMYIDRGVAWITVGTPESGPNVNAVVKIDLSVIGPPTTPPS